MSSSRSTCPAATPQPGVIDNFADTLMDLTDYEPFPSPSLSPESSIKTTFARPIVKSEAPQTSLLSSSQPLTGPSHQYDLYKQQTGIVPGALATTLAVNQNNSHILGFPDFSNLDYLAMADADESFDFNTAPSQGSTASPDLPELEMNFDSPDPNFYVGTVNPSSIGGHEPGGLSPPSPLSTYTSNVGRLWPGMHQQAALARAEQQRQRAQQQQQAKHSQKPRGTDPIVEQKISQLLHSMRSNPPPLEPLQNPPIPSLPRSKKDEALMDDDERLLASEEGKKLSSKERRQLRNKVSARAFRSRRKEYIQQLESELAAKGQENGSLRAEIRALADENQRLQDLTRMLLGSPSFSDFLERLSSNPQQLPQARPQQQQAQQQQPQQQSQQQQQRQVPKDVNPYATAQAAQLQQQQIGLAMIPEQTMQLSMLNMGAANGFYRAQVYAVLETPEPALDAAVLSGKTTTSFMGEQFDAAADDEKMDMPVIEHPHAPVELEKNKKPEAGAAPVNDEFENDPAFALYHDSPAASSASDAANKAKKPVELDTEALSQIDIFGGIEPEKALARYELVDATEEEASACLAMARVQRINASLEGLAARLELLTVGL